MDFGDVIFFIVFVIIIITNIMKQLKKADKQTSGKETSGIEKPKKKSGWKNVLEHMLEEARKQMENPVEPESAGTPLKHPSGWEDLITGKSPVEKDPEIRPERTKVARPPKRPIIHDDLILEKAKFRPECMRCNDPMKEITDLGTGKQSGLIYCDSCGEQHKYQILNGELKLNRADAVRKKSVIAPERSYQEVDEKRGAHGKMSAPSPAPEEGVKIPRQMSRADLRTAVVWSEILGKPLGLRDIEI